MPQATYGFSVQAGGVSIQGAAVRSGDGVIGKEIVLPAAKPITNWVKTDANTASCDLPSGHGYANGTFDVYWVGGRRVDVPGTISTNALALDGGSGDDFPPTGNLTVVVCRQVAINVAIDGDALKLLAIRCEYPDTALTSRARVLFEDASGDDITDRSLIGNVAEVHDIEGGANNPFTGDPITSAKASHENTNSAATLKICGVDDSTPP
jgi:hypothetical protein